MKEQSFYRSLGVTVDEESFGKRVDYFLAQSLPFYSRCKWRQKVANGDLLVSGRQVRPSYRVRECDQFAIFHPVREEPDVDSGIFPIWKSGDVMAVYKPGNLPMHENGPYRFNTFSHLLMREYGQQWAAIHRLDRETSGIVLCGATYEVRKQLSHELAAGLIKKEYLAISKGRPAYDHFKEFGAIGDLTESTIRIKKWVVADGQPAETWFDVLEHKPGHCLLRARPQTGRTNQIRIHAAVNGLPLVGDKLYHPDEAVFDEFFRNRGNNDWIIEQTGFHRLCLHAARLSFKHPCTGEECVVESPLPEDMAAFWAQLPE